MGADISEEQCCEGCVFGGFEDDSVAHGQRGGDFPCQHQQGEVPRDDLAADAEGCGIGQLRVHQLRHACVVVEVALGQRDINVARFADGLTVVEGLHHGEQAAVFLQQAREGIENLCTRMPACGCPFRLGAAGRFYGSIHVCLGALGDISEDLAIGGIAALEYLTHRGHGAVNEMAKAAALIHDPRQRFGGVLGGGAIVHGRENIGYGHLCGLWFRRWGDGSWRNSCR